MSFSLSVNDSVKGRSTVIVPCSCGCGTPIQRQKSALNPSGRHYVSRRHAGDHQAQVYLQDMCGPLLGLALEYLNGFAKSHYKDLRTVRCSICPFFLFMNETGITDLERITPKTITEYLQWADEFEHTNAAHDITYLNGFFDWACRHGHRSAKSPVISSFHGKRRPHYQPRPYSAEEMDFIWRLASERGNTRIRAALAIGQESGPRIGEICNLRVSDVDLDGLWLFIRLPNKTNTERWAKFTDRAAKYIAAWLSDRDSSCGHDFLFYNTLLDPMRPESLHAEFCRTFCKSHGGRVIHEEGLEWWSTHRLRHTMASNLASGGASITTIMGAGGWKSPSPMLGYTKIDMDLARRGYDEAMARAYERQQKRVRPQTMSLEQFLAAHGDDIRP